MTKFRGLRSIIRSTGTTMKHVAEKLDLHPSTLTKYDSGQLDCPATTRYALAYLLGCKRADIDRALEGGDADAAEDASATALDNQDRGTATQTGGPRHKAEPSRAV